MRTWTGEREKCRDLNWMIYLSRFSFKLAKEPVRTQKRRKNKHIWNYKPHESSLHTHKAECSLFVAVVSRFDKNLKAAS